MAKPMNEQLQVIVFDLLITANDQAKSSTIQNTSGDVFVWGGDVQVFDNAGRIADTTRCDQFNVDIQANEKNSILNQVMDIQSLKKLLQSENFPGFELGNEAKTKITITHAYPGAVVSAVPVNIKVSLFSEPLEHRKQRLGV